MKELNYCKRKENNYLLIELAWTKRLVDILRVVRKELFGVRSEHIRISTDNFGTTCITCKAVNVPKKILEKIRKNSSPIITLKYKGE